MTERDKSSHARVLARSNLNRIFSPFFRGAGGGGGERGEGVVGGGKGLGNLFSRTFSLACPQAREKDLGNEVELSC